MARKNKYSKYRNFYQKNNRKEYSSQGRIYFIYFAIFAIFLGLLGKLYILQVKEHFEYSQRAESTHQTTQVLTPKRGLIYCQDKDKDHIPVAINKKYLSLFAVPKDIENPKEVSETLAEIIPLSFDAIFERLNKSDDPYELLLKKVEDEDLIKEIKELELKGIDFEEKYERYYPFESFAAQTIGFIAEQEEDEIKRGRYGLEFYYEKILAGQTGIFQGIKDAFNRLVRSNSSQEKKEIEGISIETTIDKNVQFTTQKALEDLVETRKASKGTIIVMEVKTGKILALANWPTFNLNEFSETKDYSIYRNYAVEERYEPGSVIKPFTMFAGIDTGAVTPDTTYVDKGYHDVGGYHIINYEGRVYGESTMRKVLEFSINTGAIFVADQVGSETLRNYFTKFGFGETTGIDLPNEVMGDLSNLEYPKVNPSYFATASYGVGISTTPMALIRAFAIIANKGKAVTPYLVESTRDSAGKSIALSIPDSTDSAQQIVNAESAETLTSMLVGVIENGFGGNAKVKGYSLAGKTGTAFVPLKDKAGYTEEEIHTFVGFFPASDPEYIILVKMDQPQWGEGAASQTVTLAFREVESFLINYYNIPPDQLE